MPSSGELDVLTSSELECTILLMDFAVLGPCGIFMRAIPDLEVEGAKI